ncbi:TPA: hypothetical protein KNJ99_001519 [Clostridioides difficile]|nr:hypothetical protein [Clostridioides difficile]HBF0052165.1 hypothetical protein [Clostridioides difficile]HBF2792958.1 hypothetical protein [Clostridioides difficile]HBH1622508.1 hypothetical protein [Clostridioides difficile]
MQVHIAEKDTCNLEHILSIETIRALQNQLIQKGVVKDDTITRSFMDKRL